MQQAVIKWVFTVVLATFLAACTINPLEQQSQLGIAKQCCKELSQVSLAAPLGAKQTSGW